MLTATDFSTLKDAANEGDEDARLQLHSVALKIGYKLAQHGTKHEPFYHKLKNDWEEAEAELIIASLIAVDSWSKDIEFEFHAWRVIRRHLNQYLASANSNLVTTTQHQVFGTVDFQRFSQMGSDEDSSFEATIADNNEEHCENKVVSRSYRICRKLYNGQALEIICQFFGWGLWKRKRDKSYLALRHMTTQMKVMEVVDEFVNIIRTVNEKYPDPSYTYIYTCRCCNTIFLTPKLTGQKYCSEGCKQKHTLKHSSYLQPHECGICGKSFVGPKRRQYCSPRCAGKASRIIRREELVARNCAFCRKTFLPDTSNRTQKFCSVQCHGRHKVKVNKLRNRRKCPHCSKSFIKNKTDQVYCSKECGSNAVNVPAREIVQRYSRKCAHCKKQFRCDPSHVAKYCSKACFNAHRKPKLRACKWCKNEFYPYQKQLKYCSQDCAKQDWLHSTTPCQVCSKPIVGRAASIKYCSPECKQAARPRRICEHCGKEYVVRKESQGNKYCGWRCASIVREIQKKLNAPVRICIGCNKEYRRVQRTDMPDICSASCRKRIRSHGPASVITTLWLVVFITQHLLNLAF